MAPEYLQTDVHGLYILAELLDGFWRKPSHFRAAEIRLQGQNYGLSPLDRRRLQWEIEEDEGEVAPQQRPTPVPPTTDDPRRHLAAV